MSRTTIKRLAAVRACAVVALGGLAALALGGCSSSGSTGPATGSLTVTITGPAGVTPSVTVSGPAGYHQTLTATETLAGLAAGSYTVSAAGVTVANPVVATVYAGTATGSPATVTAGGTAVASVGYAQQPGTGGVWIANDSAPTVVEYAATQLAATTTVAPTGTLGTGAGIFVNEGLAFDASGNLWLVGGAGANSVVEYSAAQLASTGSPTPAVTLSASGGSLNFPAGLAFDANGSLWVANQSGKSLVEFLASQLGASGSPIPPVTLTDTAGSLSGPFALAFDGRGDLWVADEGGNTVVEFTPSQLTASGSPVPAVTLSATSGSLNAPAAPAFDANGNLWVVNFAGNSVVEFTPGQLASNGSPTPAVTLTASSGSINGPLGLAFDASGDLWVINTSGNTVVEFSVAQLVTSGAPTPAVTVSGSALSQPFGLAFNPHAANLPVKP